MRTPVGPPTQIVSIGLSRLSQENVICGERRAAPPARLPRGGLNPDIFEAPVAQHLAIRHAVERDSARQAQVLRAGLLRERARQPQHRFLDDALHGSRQIYLALRERLLGIAGGSAEQVVEFPIGHPQPDAVVEVTQIEAETAVLFKVNQIFENPIAIYGRAVRRQSHDLVLAGIYLEPGVIGERGIKQSERMRKAY